jgi:HK97 gp10 family phage protein
MSAKTTVKVEGLRALGEAMRGLSADVNLKISRAAIQAGAKIIKDLAIAKAPIAPEAYTVRRNKADKEGVKVEPRNIQKNIVTKRVKNSSLTAETVIAIRGKRKNGYASRVATLQEFGTVKMAAQPFMRPAFEEGKMPAVEAVKRRLTTRIAKAVKDRSKK